MHFQTTPENNSEEGGISDKSVLVVTLLLSAVLFLSPIFQTLAETMTQGEEEQIVINITDRDYTILLSSLFGRVGREVPESAYEYVKDIDEYRSLVAQGIKDNDDLTAVLHIKVNSLPKNLAEGYRAELDGIQGQVLGHKVAIAPYIESDALLSRAVVEQYDLYTSFIERFIDGMNVGISIDNLNKIRTESSLLRKDIALLYQRINTIMRAG